MKRTAAVLLLAAVACVPQPPAAPVARSATSIQAPFEDTWRAVVDVFAERNLPIRTIDKSSGLIAAEPLKAGIENADEADCGKTSMGLVITPTDAVHNVVVRGDSTSSTVKVTVRWTSFNAGDRFTPASTTTCSTTGKFESTVEAEIKARAESARAASAGDS